MTSDGKIGLLISFLFIVTIAFLINGPVGFFKTDKPVIETAVQAPPSRSILIEQAVEQVARELEPEPLRQTQPPSESRVIAPAPTAQPQPASAPNSPSAPETAPAASAASTTAVPTPSAASPAPSTQVHIVQKGENLAVIASRYYGKENGNTRAVIQKLYQANQHILTSPDSLRIGDKLVIPPLDKGTANTGQTSSPKPEKVLLEKFKNVLEPASSERPSPRYIEYVVQPGDRLWTIALQYLGDGNRYREIVQLNRDQISDPENLPAGIRLKIPAR
ncbi:MAG TPA: LysM peptidoglycan-binding domain-containing protein [Anaerohalosphaeraceae bacterium]|nr:LysM peptidoglycan-binding domain-containing protein [Anaerohalosphaeraceae bacterium]HOL89285.1 LysM peptidoglycan-binding domain-containing protein [Anaerohalosphaeraceae bacterium]HPP56869.1 LysM peptidoglycan-binding domain-containing protein [Anaerohalosphaeraceae bacterium]